MEFKMIDNKMTLLGDDLKSEILSGSKVRIAASCFTLFAFNELKEELSKIEDFKLIFTEPTYTKNDYIGDAAKREKREFYIPKIEREGSLFGTDLEIKLRNKMNLKAIAKECAKWAESKAKFSSNVTNNNMQNFIVIEKEDGGAVTYSPTPKEFSASGLGYEKSNEMFTFVMKNSDAAMAQTFIREFDDIFKDTVKTEDVTEEVVKSITTAYKENSPEFIYFIILYNIFTEFLDDLSEDNMPNEATGFKKSKLWGMLYDFQKEGAVSIINKIEKHNGCILADSVGLGKTFTALAVIMYYTLRNKSVLVLCPKRLSENWTQYINNDNTNILYEDKLRYDVLYHTDLGRFGSAHNGRDLKLVNWGNYDLVVIDESHNFRNNNPVRDKETRYDFLMNHIIKEGVNTKVLMLSATPVNNRYNDLKNQLAIAYGGDYEKFESSLDTKSNISTIFRNAQALFNDWSKKPVSERTNKELIDSLSIDFKILLDSVTIARSRKSIVKYYNINDIGKFPDRLQPISHFPNLTGLENVPSYKEIYQSIKGLSLAVYGLFDYVLDSRKEEYERRYDVEIKGSGLTSKTKYRDSGIKRLMTVNLLKRLESSVEAFRLTVKGMLELNKFELARLGRYMNGELKHDMYATKKVFNYEMFDQEEDGGLNLSKTDKGKDVSINYDDIDCHSWKDSLEKDVEILKGLLSELGQIDPDNDEKLQVLKEIICGKLSNPINEGNKKVLIFSAFADTANYLYDNISKCAKENHGIETALIEGSGNKATLKNCPKQTNHLLTMFSPISKNRDVSFSSVKSWIDIYNNPNTKLSHKIDRRGYDDSFTDIDILIATDCISEGQNLQDCDLCINYDIHWNPVRIVQRFGRIDRIGSKNNAIQLVNFWPPLLLNEYINLTERVKSRMTIVDQAATADDNLLNPDDQIDDYREVQIKRLQKGENIELEDASNGISISDLGLNEFRMDAVELLGKYGEPRRVPKGMHAVISRDDSNGIVPGIIFVLKNYNNNVNVKSQNRLHPYYVVYLDEKGNLINSHLQAKQILDLLRISSNGQNVPIESAYTKFNKSTDDGVCMDKYNSLLANAVSTIIEVKEQGDLMSLLAGNIEVLQDKSIKGLDDFELLAFVAVK